MANLQTRELASASHSERHVTASSGVVYGTPLGRRFAHLILTTSLFAMTAA